MASRRYHDNEGGWRPCLILTLITFATCGAVYFALSPLFSKSEGLQESVENILQNTRENSACCRGIEHQELWGRAVKWGTDHKMNSSQECCQACKAMCSDDGPCFCNSWVFCGDPTKCGDKLGQCWLKKQEDALAPDVQDSKEDVVWTSGLVYGKGMGIVVLETEYGAIHIKLLPDCAPLSVAYILDLLKTRHCAGCKFYRAEGRGTIWDADGNRIDKRHAGPPYALVQGTLEAQGLNFKEIPREASPSIKRGMVGWVESGPEFFISLANHAEWYPKYTVFASVLPEDMPLVEKIVSTPTTSAVWNGISVSVLQKHISLRLKRPVNLRSSVDI